MVREIAGVVCSLAAVVSTTAMKHQYWAQHEYLSPVRCQSKVANMRSHRVEVGILLHFSFIDLSSLPLSFFPCAFIFFLRFKLEQSSAVICGWSSPAQSFLVLGPVGTYDQIFVRYMTTLLFEDMRGWYFRVGATFVPLQHERER
jgi:hypothetical protein